MEAKLEREMAVRQLCRDFLSCDPTEVAIEGWVGSGLTLDEISADIQESGTFEAFKALEYVRQSKNYDRKVLLFGAYGNGNLGDMIQAESLRRSITNIFPSAGVWATTVMDGSYPFPDEFTLPARSIRYCAGQNLFDTILIGGGGLFAHPHEPLDDEVWIEALTEPVVLFGIGSSDAFAPQAATLIRKAAHVLGRDLDSIASLVALREDVAFVIDPVLGDRYLAFPPMNGRKQGICWIVRGPVSPIHDEIAAACMPGDTIVGFEPNVDAPLVGVFPSIQFVTTTEDFFAIAQRSERIVSMRYHGVVLGLKMGLPVFALDVRKGAALLEMLGIPECASENLSDLIVCRVPDANRTSAILRWLENLYELKLQSVLNTIWSNSQYSSCCGEHMVSDNVSIVFD